jgi:AraC family transcriptional regulator of adaptative response/methylated-DNA-[protein]-cysteine methyltransferase
MHTTDDDARWAQVETRHKAADGRFWCVVKTTGIYCRPSCPGRPHRRNVSFHDSLASARSTGARACKRCDPDVA